jgi:5-methylcytosine-specific restriction endonuclease McrA
MPSFCCKHPTCQTYLPARGYCPAHAEQGKQSTATKFYDQHVRNPAAKQFYNSAAWERTRADVLAENPVCQRCGEAFSAHVHHVIPLSECTEAQKTDRGNLWGVCPPCHNTIEAEMRAKGK